MLERAAQDVGRDELASGEDGVGDEGGAPLAEGAPWTPRSGSGDGSGAQQLVLESVRVALSVPPDVTLRCLSRPTPSRLIVPPPSAARNLALKQDF